MSKRAIVLALAAFIWDAYQSILFDKGNTPVWQAHVQPLVTAIALQDPQAPPLIYSRIKKSTCSLQNQTRKVLCSGVKSMQKPYQ